MEVFMNLSLDDISDMHIKDLGFDPFRLTKADRKELMQYAFVEDALSEEDAIESQLYPYGRPSKWNEFYNKWLALDLTRTGGFPSVLLGTLFVLTAPFTLSKIWIIDPIMQKIRG